MIELASVCMSSFGCFLFYPGAICFDTFCKNLEDDIKDGINFADNGVVEYVRKYELLYVIMMGGSFITGQRKNKRIKARHEL